MIIIEIPGLSSENIQQELVIFTVAYKGTAFWSQFFPDISIFMQMHPIIW